MAQSIQVSTPSRTGAPDGAGDHRTPANLSAPLIPKIRDSSRCPSASTLTQKWPARAIRCQLVDRMPGQNSTSGGSRDSAANAWQANPTGSPPSTPVTTVTPVQKCPSTWRKRSGRTGVTASVCRSLGTSVCTAARAEPVAPQADRCGLPGHPGRVVHQLAVGAVLDVEPARGTHVERHHQVVG